MSEPKPSLLNSMRRPPSSEVERAFVEGGEVQPKPIRSPIENLDIARLQRPKRVLRVHATFNLPDRIQTRLKKISNRTDIDMVDIVAAALDKYLDTLAAHFNIED